MMNLEDYRLGIFIGLVILLGLIELIFPIYTNYQHKLARWGSNFGLSLISTAMLKLSYIPLAAEFANIVAAKQIGLFNWVEMPSTFSIIFAVLLLDMGIYWQHVLAHHWPLLWRLHKVHHSDEQMDLSTAIRFHPFEILFSMLLKFALIAIIGAPAIAVVLFELILSSGALFNHSNIRFSKKMDKILQYVLVTPNMHRIHHSDKPHETNSNYGFSVSLWDHIFKSFTPNHNADADITIGLKASHGKKTHFILWCLTYPFKK